MKIYDGYNGKSKESDYFGTLTTNSSFGQIGVYAVEVGGGALMSKNTKLLQVAQQKGSYESTGRIYSAEGLVPTINTCGGGQREPKVMTKNKRVRRLTARECGRLMGVRDEDLIKIERHQSPSSQYHLYGDSIVVNVLMAIFGQMTTKEEKN